MKAWLAARMIARRLASRIAPRLTAPCRRATAAMAEGAKR